jgi:hypothetical protein
MDWHLDIGLHWPHDRFALGWEYIGVDDEYDYRTFKLYLLCLSFTLNF